MVRRMEKGLEMKSIGFGILRGQGKGAQVKGKDVGEAEGRKTKGKDVGEAEGKKIRGKDIVVEKGF